MADENSGSPGEGGGGTPPAKRLPDKIKKKGPDSRSSTSMTTTGTKTTSGGELGSITGENSLGDFKARGGFFDVERSETTSRGLASAGIESGRSVDAGVGRIDAKTNPNLAGGLLGASGKGSLLSADAEAKGTAKLTREGATLSGKLGASAMVAEVEGKAELILTPKRIINGVIVNGVNAFAEWRGYQYRMQKIQSGWLDHGIVLGVEGGVGYGAKAKAEGQVGYKPGEGASVEGSVSAAAGPGGKIGGKIGIR